MVVRDSSQNLLLQGLGQLLLVGVTQVLHEVVLLAVLEHVEVLLQHGVEVLNAERSVTAEEVGNQSLLLGLLGLGRHGHFGVGSVVLLEGLVVVEESLIVRRRVSEELLLGLGVVSDIDVLELLLLFVGIAVINVLADLSLHSLVVLLRRALTVGHNLLLLKSLESLSVVPVAVELLHLFGLVEVHHGQLMTPEGSIGELMGL
mmetsp:Transcript_36144/g.55502  ORF Transcript_36144/g.55502 Transcript_36144/m.55502 type:complete len:203 (-) Transcript_36144:690-1298(-)